MTTIVYNGVVMRDCETKSFSQTIEYDPSGTDLMFSRFTLRVASTLVATSYPAKSFGIDTPSGLTATQRAKDVHARLSEPRKDFWMLIESSVNNEKLPSGVFNESLLTATGDLTSDGGQMLGYPNVGDGYFGGGTISRASVIDVNNGPHPRQVSITEIIAGRSMRVEFEIEICRKLCMPVYPDLPPDAARWGLVDTSTTEVLSNRWHLEESKDENWITTRVLDGTLRVKSQDTWPHLMRAVCIPPLLKGYKRTRQSFVDDPTGLVLKYTIEDRQAHAAPPYPAISWNGHHAESASGPNGSLLSSEFSIKLTGPPGVDKVQLIGAAAKVAVDRIQGLVPNFIDGKRQSYSTILKNAAIVNILHEPTIEMRVQVQYTDSSFKALALRIQGMGKPLTSLKKTGEPDSGNQYDEQRYKVEEYDPRTWPVPLAYDSVSPAGIFACYLQNPCSIWHDMPDGKTSVTSATRKSVSDSGSPDYHPSTIVHSPHALPPDTNYLKSMTGDNIYDYPYTFVDLESQYRINNGWSQLPLADTTPAAARTARLIKLHGSVAKRILTMTASRDGKMPMLPSLAEKTTDHNGIKEALDEVTITAKAPELLAGAQSRRFAVEAVYVYLLERAPRTNEKLRVGSTQLDKVLPIDNWLNLAQSVDSGEIQSSGASW